MPDIAMCVSHKCPIRGACYRYRAVPAEPWQWYSDHGPDDGSCKDFDAIDGRPVLHKDELDSELVGVDVPELPLSKLEESK